MNILNGRQWSLDTPGTVWTREVKILQVFFTGYGQATDVATLQNLEGTMVINLKGTADLQEVRTGAFGWVHGLILASLTPATTGKVIVDVL